MQLKRKIIKNFDSENQNEGVIMQIIFKRRLTNELLTTYLPSFFLLGICYSTIHFKPFYFEAAVTVNLTVMLVATTLFVRCVGAKMREQNVLFINFSA